MRVTRVLHVIPLSLFAAAAFSMGLSAQEGAEHAKSPSIITFDAPGAGSNKGATNCFGGCPGTVAVNGNAEGAVTGYSVDDAGVYHGFVRYPDGKIKTFDAKGAGTGPGQGTVAYSINVEGAIAGQFQDANNVYHGFLRSPNGFIICFDIPGFQAGPFQGPDGAANINDAGEIAGFYLDENNVNQGFVRYANGKIKTFGVPAASTLPNAAPQGTLVALESGLNDQGAITGWYFDSGYGIHGYVRARDGVIATFDNLDAGTGSFQGTYGGSINSEGEIAGAVLDASYVFHGLIRYTDGNMKTFDAPSAGTTANNFFGTFAVGINQAGTITAYVTDDSNLTHGAVRDREGNITIFDVNSAGTGGGQGTTPQGINATGIVMGYYTDANNVNHGFLRLPRECPESN